MMTSQSPAGCFQLKQDIRLIEATEGGVLLQSNPLRALKINQAALDILQKCRTGLQVAPGENGAGCRAALPFLDAFIQGGLLDWKPSEAEVLPMVSIVIPVYNRPLEIQECLASLISLDYPDDKLEVIVVDDASRDHTAAMVRRFDARLIIQPHNQGQSAARNVGVGVARGEIIAFLDSDCIARPGWLRELVPYFQDPRVALVGGQVDVYYRQKRLDRYEEVCSALNMGPEPVKGRGESCVFYVPTCNMLVRKKAYQQVGGLDESLRVGEDVDLCWRMMATGHHLFYIPRGQVKHKHRNHFLSAFLRRFDYGTSEAVLYSRFPKVVKQFPWQPAGIGIILAGMAALATRSWPWLVLMAVLSMVEIAGKRNQLRRIMNIQLPVAEIIAAVFKSHFQLAYYLTFYVVRYYLLLLLVLAWVLPALIWLWLAVIIFPTLVTYLRKMPRLSLPVFAFFYLAEHAFYQCGAFWGCLKEKRFRLYGISFKYAGFLHRSRPKRKIRSMKIKPTSKAVMSR